MTRVSFVAACRVAVAGQASDRSICKAIISCGVPSPFVFGLYHLAVERNLGFCSNLKENLARRLVGKSGFS
uniref:Uncharacterized protein n=1 Tax=Oryza nivara TaxID=4536 RepID=A0A0E0FVS1_ORYNI